jgi:preprotein translocase subunit YajC
MEAAQVIVGSVLAAGSLAAPLAASNGKSGGSSYGFLIILVLFGALIYMFVLRPQRNRVRRSGQLQREIEVGQRVMTASGLFGTVAAVEDDAVLIEVAPGVTTRWARAAIGRVVPPEDSLGLDDARPPADGGEPGA